MENKTKNFPGTISQADMRAINRSAVVEFLRLKGAASRTEISRQLHISKPTVMRIIDDLRQTKFVIPVGKQKAGGGRHRELLSLNPSDNLVIGIDIGGSHISGALINIVGEILEEETNSVSWSGTQKNFSIISQFIAHFTAGVKNKSRNIIGITIGVPGIIERGSGVVKLAPSLDWYGFPLLENLKERFDIPVLVENDVNLAVQGEHWFGRGVGVNDLIMIAIGTGIGAGVILDGRLHRGFSESSGEIGYLLPSIDCLENSYPGFGALELVASGGGIAKSAGKEFSEEVFAAAAAGEEEARAIIESAVDALSLAIANVASCFDPQLIILGGGVSKGYAPYVEKILTRITNVIPNVPRLEVSDMQERAVLLGAAVSVYKKILGYSVVYQY